MSFANTINTLKNNDVIEFHMVSGKIYRAYLCDYYERIINVVPQITSTNAVLVDFNTEKTSNLDIHMEYFRLIKDHMNAFRKLLQNYGFKSKDILSKKRQFSIVNEREDFLRVNGLYEVCGDCETLIDNDIMLNTKHIESISLLRTAHINNKRITNSEHICILKELSEYLY